MQHAPRGVVLRQIFSLLRLKTCRWLSALAILTHLQTMHVYFHAMGKQLFSCNGKTICHEKNVWHISIRTTISYHVAYIRMGSCKKVILGNISKRDVICQVFTYVKHIYFKLNSFQFFAWLLSSTFQYIIMHMHKIYSRCYQIFHFNDEKCMNNRNQLVVALHGVPKSVAHIGILLHQTNGGIIHKRQTCKPNCHLKYLQKCSYSIRCRNLKWTSNIIRFTLSIKWVWCVYTLCKLATNEVDMI